MKKFIFCENFKTFVEIEKFGFHHFFLSFCKFISQLTFILIYCTFYFFVNSIINTCISWGNFNFYFFRDLWAINYGAKYWKFGTSISRNFCSSGKNCWSGKGMSFQITKKFEKKLVSNFRNLTFFKKWDQIKNGIILKKDQISKKMDRISRNEIKRLNMSNFNMGSNKILKIGSN